MDSDVTRSEPNPVPIFKGVNVFSELPNAEVSPLIRSADIRPMVSCNIFGKKFFALLDSGSMVSCISNVVVRKCPELNEKTVHCPTSFLSMANGSKMPVSGSVLIELSIGDNEVKIPVLVVPGLSSNVILGADALVQLGVVVDFGNRFWYSRSSSSPQVFSLSSGTLEIDNLGNLVDYYQGLFKFSPGKTTLIEHHIDVRDAKPIKQRYYPMSPIMLSRLNEEIDNLLAEDLIEPSKSAWSSPIFLVKKKDGVSYRHILDARSINLVAKKDSYPLPYISTILDRLQGMKFFSKIDLAQAFFQVPLTESSKEITAFVVPGRGLFHYKYMPQGLSGSPSTFQRLMDSVLGADLELSTYTYLDDVVVMTKTLEEHIRVLKIVFDRLLKAGLKIRWEKSEFAKNEIKYLGHVVNVDGIRVDPGKIECMVDFPRPKTVKQVRSFLGLVSWYRRFVPEFSTIVSPMNGLLKKNAKFIWSTDCENAFIEIKKRLTSAPVLVSPDFSKRFFVQTDASGVGLGAVLTQKLEGEDHIIAYASRSLTKSEKLYSATELEALAVVWAVEKFRPYLEGYTFTVITDHSALSWLFKLKQPCPARLLRWVLRLQAFDFDVHHRPGRVHNLPDQLSRIPEISTLTFSDPEYTTLLEDIQNSPTSHPDMSVSGGYVWKYVPKFGHRSSPDAWKIYVPVLDRQTVLKEMHDSLRFAHLGIYKTYHKLSQVYVWSGMLGDVRKYVARCLTCQEFKRAHGKVPGTMTPRQEDGPWKTIAIDLAGPLAKAKCGFQYFLVVVDIFSKWVEAFPLVNATASAIKRKLEEEVFFRYGYPLSLLSDNGPQFKDKRFKDYLADCHVKHLVTTPYSPHMNPAERSIKTIKSCMVKFLKSQKDWPSVLPHVLFAIRTSRHESTNFSPGYLNFGREPRLPAPVTSYLVESNVSSEYVKHFSSLRDIFRKVQDFQFNASARQKRYYDLRHREVSFKVNDMVWRTNFVKSSKCKGFSAKLAPKFVGPFKVLKRRGKDVYLLGDTDNNEMGCWHVRHLKPFVD